MQMSQVTPDLLLRCACGGCVERFVNSAMREKLLAAYRVHFLLVKWYIGELRMAKAFVWAGMVHKNGLESCLIVKRFGRWGMLEQLVQEMIS